MSIDLRGLLEDAFFEEELKNASEGIERALDAYQQQTKMGAHRYEVVAPPEPDEQWVREGLAHPLIYFCESEGAPPPKCGGVIVALFVGSRLYGITAERVIRWASEQLGSPVEQLRREYGTHEVETAVR